MKTPKKLMFLSAIPDETNLNDFDSIREAFSFIDFFVQGMINKTGLKL